MDGHERGICRVPHDLEGLLGFIRDLPETVFQVDGKGRIAYLNGAGLQAFGYALDDLQAGLAFEALIIPEDRPALQAALVLEGLQRRACRCLRRSGEALPAVILVQGRWGEGGWVGASGVIVLDSPAERMERALQESESRLEAVLENLPFDLWACDRTGRYVLQNPVSRKAWGDFMGKTLEDLDVPSEMKEAWRRSNRRVLGGEMIREEGLLTVNGELRCLDQIMAPIREGDAITGILGANLDVTEERQMEQDRSRLQSQLTQAQKMEAIGQLAGGVAHDFNNLLTVIMGQAELIQARVPRENALQRHVEALLSASQRAKDLTTQLLAFGRRQILQPKLLDLNAVVRDSEKILRRLIGEHIEVHTHLLDALPQVYADPGQLSQVILNLAINARDAMPRGGALRLSTQATFLQMGDFPGTDLAPGLYLALVVEDTGIGMDPETMARIFEPFFTTKGSGQGTGLGLATVYGILKQSGGHIHVESTPGKGSRFTALLPAVRQEQEAPAVAKIPALPRATETILLVEDDEGVRFMTAQMLQHCGYRVLPAEDGTRALAILGQGERVDLLLTDFVMPRMDGRELALHAKGLCPGLRILFMSGYALAPDGSQIVDADSFFLNKPFQMDELNRKIREVLQAAP